MTAHAPIGIHNDLTAGQTTISVRPADDKTTGWVHVNLGFFIQHFGWQNRIKDMFFDILDNLFVLDVVIVLETLEKDLHNTYQMADIGFTGQTSAMSFPGLVRSGPDQSEKPGRISYYYSSATSAIAKSESDYAGSPSPGRDLAQVTAVSFKYGDLLPEDNKLAWTASWQDPGRLPACVEVQVQFRQGEKETQMVRTMLIPVSH